MKSIRQRNCWKVRPDNLQWSVFGSMGADALALLKQGMEICEEPSGPYMYHEALEKEYEGWEYFLAAENLQQMYERRNCAEGEKLKANRDKAVDKELSEAVKEIRKQTKGILGEVTKSYLFQSTEAFVEDLQLGRDTVEELVRLVKKFSAIFSEKKRSRLVLDFGDMEQLALQILTEKQDGEFVPSPVAKEYQERFREIMIDEYQDSNLIQETILTSVSTISKGKYNLFYGRRYQTEHLQLPFITTGTFYGKIRKLRSGGKSVPADRSP